MSLHNFFLNISGDSVDIGVRCSNEGPLVQSIVDFVTQEDGGDVEALRKAMYSQVNMFKL